MLYIKTFCFLVIGFNYEKMSINYFWFSFIYLFIYNASRLMYIDYMLKLHILINSTLHIVKIRSIKNTENVHMN